MEHIDLPAPSDFIREIIEEHFRRPTGFKDVLQPGFHPNRMDICTLAMPSPSALISVSPASMGGPVIYAWMTPIQAAKSQEYVDSIIRDVRWLGFDWEDRLYYASDYYERLYQFAVQLIRLGQGLCVQPERG